MSTSLAEKFFNALFGERKGFVELRIMDGLGVMPRFWKWPDRKDAALKDVGYYNDSNVFSGVLLRDTLGKGDADHTEKFTEWLWADVDVKRGSTFGSILRAVMHTPQMVVDSGHGWHLYWHLSRPVPVAVAQGAMKVLAERLGGDAVGDAARIMRVPGTINHKDGDSIPVRFLRYDLTYAHRFGDFDLPEVEGRYTAASDYEDGEWTLSPDDAPKFGEGERNTGMTRLAGAMLFKGMGHEEILTALRAENEVRCVPPMKDTEVQAIVRSVSRYR
jgi:hypothetical protein